MSCPDSRSLDVRQASCRRTSRRWSSVLEAKACAGRDHGWPSGVDGIDNLGRVDALKVRAGHAEMSVPELPLDHRQRHSLARHLYRVRVTELVRREPATYTGQRREPSQLGARPGL